MRPVDSFPLAPVRRVPSPEAEAFARHLAQLRAQVDTRLALLVPPVAHEGDRIGAAMRHGALAPGKRVRPLLLLLATEDLGGAVAVVLDAACALELVHAASLLIDDLPCMDDAQLRRGQPTAHVRFGQDVAILAAIGLLGLAFRVVASAEPVAAALRIGWVALLADAVGTAGLVQGQYRDLHGAHAPCGPEAIAQTNQLKTGSLFTAALAMAALASDATACTGEALQAFAEELGQAFQLLDDLADLSGSTAELGKDVGRDAAKLTLPALLGAAATRERIEAHLASGQRRLEAALGPASRLARFARGLLAGAPA